MTWKPSRRTGATAPRSGVPFPASARARLEDIYAKPNRALFDETGPLDW